MSLKHAVSLALGTLLVPTVLVGQAPAFDIERAWVLDSTRWSPFLVTETVPLRDARSSGRVRGETTVLLLEHQGVTMTLVTSQMAYHHIAQGDIKGIPWMVSF